MLGNFVFIFKPHGNHFVWNNVWGKPIVNYMKIELFGQKAYSNFKLHGNQFCVE
jgi:hypothetical protein